MGMRGDIGLRLNWVTSAEATFSYGVPLRSVALLSSDDAKRCDRLQLAEHSLVLWGGKCKMSCLGSRSSISNNIRFWVIELRSHRILGPNCSRRGAQS